MPSDAPSAPARPSHSPASPLPVRDAIAAITGSDMPESSKAASQSVLLITARYLAQREGRELSDAELLEYDLRPSLSILHAAARDVARAREVRRPTEYVSRAARVVELITGVRPTSRRFREACPPEFQPLLAAASGVHAGAHASGSFAYLSRVCRYAGHFDAPRTFPSFDTMYAAALELAKLDAAAEGTMVSQVRVRRRLLDALSSFRCARARLVERATEEEQAQIDAQFAVVGRFRNQKRACHLGVEPQVLQHLRARGLKPELMSLREILDAVNPALADDFQAWVTETNGARLAASTQEQTLGALLRVCGAIVRAGHFDKLLALEGVDDLFAVSITVPGTRKLNSRAARRAGVSAAEVQPEVVSLLEACLEKEAARSLARSTVTTPEHVGNVG